MIKNFVLQYSTTIIFQPKLSRLQKNSCLTTSYAKWDPWRSLLLNFSKRTSSADYTKSFSCLTVPIVQQDTEREWNCKCDQRQTWLRHECNFCPIKM